MEPDRRNARSDVEPQNLTPSNDVVDAQTLARRLAAKIVEEIVPKIGAAWDKNVCLATKLVNGDYQPMLIGDLARDAESLAFDIVKTQMLRHGLVVTIDFVPLDDGLFLQRCRTGIATNVESP